MSGEVVPANGMCRSRFVARVRRLASSILPALRIYPATLVVIDVTVTLCDLLVDPEDPRPRLKRLEHYFGEMSQQEVTSGVEALANGEVDNAIEWLKGVNRAEYKAYVRRLVGAAEYSRLERALKEDAAVVSLAIRRAVRGLMPFAVAWEDALTVMTREQLSAVTKMDLLGLSLVKVIASLDSVVGEKLLPALPMEVTRATEDDLSTWQVENLADLASQFRHLVSAASAMRIDRINSPLVRKIQGARDALTYSADGVSQAANSLIELIDRLMREAYDQATVLRWIDANFTDDRDLSFVDNNGQRRATKRGEALCLVYGGGAVAREATDLDDGTGPSLIHDIAARVIVAARTRLQKFKHADIDSVSEREKLVATMVALEGALMIGLQIGAISGTVGGLPQLPETA
ncbi:hypothetical protein [Actinomadura miaoliensis]|uniref:Uncharacterized protein n=1 Tax=Actinomadura miaoliensis TaxID=430685 RepID=A0ABP7VBW2_9ACTN